VDKIAMFILKKLKNRGITIDDLAQKLNMSTSVLFRSLTGQRKGISHDKIVGLGRRLDLSLKEIQAITAQQNRFTQRDRERRRGRQEE
jgi:cyanate lyase